jgi:hypothetical protein
MTTVFNRKSKITQKFTLTVGEGSSEFQVTIRKLSTPEALDFMAECHAVQEEALKSSGRLQRATYDRTLNYLIDLIVEIYGVKDEDGSDISWSSLSDQEKYDLLAEADLDSISHLWVKVGQVGRLSEQEKKV